MEGLGRQAGLSIGWYIAFSQGSQRLVSPDPYEDLSQAPRTKYSEDYFDSFRDERNMSTVPRVTGSMCGRELLASEIPPRFTEWPP